MIQAMSKKSTPSGMIINVCSFLVKDKTSLGRTEWENSIVATLIIIIGPLIEFLYYAEIIRELQV
jgi:hypothetical protein